MSDLDKYKVYGKLVGYNRLRMGTDGKGVTTLVAMYGCPLRCKFCINSDLYNLKVKNCSIEQLYNKVVVDDLYFSYTNGGVCFGGHEPLLQSEFIREFVLYVRNKGKSWRFTVETCLNVDRSAVEGLLDYVDCWIIDIKDMNNSIYQVYTGESNEKVINNLRYMADQLDKIDVFLRIPKINGFNTEQDIAYSVRYLKSFGFSEKCFDICRYVAREE